ncbi:MAG: AAA family ATPase [Saprospiraceae bacterium]
MEIKRVEIKKLWQKGSISWGFNSDVNILVGANGSGKSTAIELIYEALQPQISDVAKFKFGLIDEMTIELEGDRFVYVDSSGERTPSHIEDWNLNISKISTFDISSSLDKLINDLKLPFEKYKNTLLQKIQDLFYKSEAMPSLEEREKLFGKQRLFVSRVNQLFGETGKSFSEDKFTFNLTGQEYELTHDKLSSGEKQIFYILLSTMLQDGKPWILLMDEPEISLHIEWQRELIRLIRELNSECQIVAVTHSPTIFFKGWEDKMVRMDQILFAQSNGITKVDLPSNTSKVKKVLANLDSKILSPIQKTKEANIFLHREFFMLSFQDCKLIIESLKDKKIIPDQFTYTTLISKLTSKKDALELLKDMDKKGILPNNVTYNHILTKSDGFEDALEVIDLMSQRDSTPNIINLSTLLGKAEKPEDTKTVEELRQKNGLEPNEIYSNKLHIKR